jgi:exoribonuclease R
MTQFTQPMDRYIDILVHRMLGLVLESKSPDNSYTILEVATQCRNSNKYKENCYESERLADEVFFGLWV